MKWSIIVGDLKAYLDKHFPDRPKDQTDEEFITALIRDCFMPVVKTMWQQLQPMISLIVHALPADDCDESCQAGHTFRENDCTWSVVGRTKRLRCICGLMAEHPGGCPPPAVPDTVSRTTEYEERYG